MVTMPHTSSQRVTNRSGGTAVLHLLGKGTGPISTVPGLAATGAYVAGAVLVIASGYIHFHLWDESGSYYRHLSIIGPLFLAQAIGGLVVGILIVAVRRVWAA